MTKLEELRELQKEYEAGPDVVDVKFFVDPTITPCFDMERIAANALILLKGSGKGIDISDVIL